MNKIEYTKNPATVDIDFLTQQINQETDDFGSAYPFGFFMYDDSDQLIAGCNGHIIFGSIYTDQLWVHSDHRKEGLGSKLMEQVHTYGREQGCQIATVMTMSFQGAQRFYEKLGYTADFERLGYTQNSSCIFLKRIL